MKFNYGLEKKKFDKMWKSLEIEYLNAGMGETAIAEMKEYDWEIFKKERNYCLHTQKINEEIFDNGDEIEFDKHPILEKYMEVFSVQDQTFIDRKDGWIELLDNERIAVYLKESPEKLKILTEYVFNDKSQAEIAIELGISQGALSQRLKTIKKEIKILLKV